jgi:hypothetical protein
MFFFQCWRSENMLMMMMIVAMIVRVYREIGIYNFFQAFDNFFFVCDQSSLSADSRVNGELIVVCDLIQSDNTPRFFSSSAFGISYTPFLCFASTYHRTTQDERNIREFGKRNKQKNQHFPPIHDDFVVLVVTLHSRRVTLYGVNTFRCSYVTLSLNSGQFFTNNIFTKHRRTQN